MRVEKKFGFHVFILFSTVCLNLVHQNTTIASDKDAPNINQEMEFVLETKNGVVDYGKEVEVDIFIKNNTDHEIQICKIPSSGINYITRFFNNGQSTFQDEFTVPTIVSQKEDFLLIAAKDKKLFSSSKFGKEYFKKPGQWSIKIVQQHNFTGEDIGLKAWTGSIESDVLRISIENNLILEGSVEVSRIGELGDRIDAYVHEGIEQHYFVRFQVDKVLKGKYTQPTMGIRLHSPSRTFGLSQKKNEGKLFKLFFINEVLSDGRSIWLLQPESKQIN